MISAFRQQKNPNNLDILAFWLANTSRLLHDMKQYSGDRVSHGIAEQNITSHSPDQWHIVFHQFYFILFFS